MSIDVKTQKSINLQKFIFEELIKKKSFSP